MKTNIKIDILYFLLFILFICSVLYGMITFNELCYNAITFHSSNKVVKSLHEKGFLIRDYNGIKYSLDSKKILSGDGIETLSKYYEEINRTDIIREYYNSNITNIDPKDSKDFYIYLSKKILSDYLYSAKKIIINSVKVIICIALGYFLINFIGKIEKTFMERELTISDVIKELKKMNKNDVVLSEIKFNIIEDRPILSKLEPKQYCIVIGRNTAKTELKNQFNTSMGCIS